MVMSSRNNDAMSFVLSVVQMSSWIFLVDTITPIEIRPSDKAESGYGIMLRIDYEGDNICTRDAHRCVPNECFAF